MNNNLTKKLLVASATSDSPVVCFAEFSFRFLDSGTRSHRGSFEEKIKPFSPFPFFSREPLEFKNDKRICLFSFRLSAITLGEGSPRACLFSGLELCLKRKKRRNMFPIYGTQTLNSSAPGERKRLCIEILKKKICRF